MPLPSLRLLADAPAFDWLTFGERYGSLAIVAWLVWFIFTKGLPQMLARQAADMTAMRLEYSNAALRHDAEMRLLRENHNTYCVEQREAFLEALAQQRGDFKDELAKRHDFEKEISVSLSELLRRIKAGDK